MDPIRPIAPAERDIEPVYRVERSGDDQQERERRQERDAPPKKETQTQTQTQDEVGPVEGDDGHLHIDVKA
jgi:hypothetical protein